MVERSAETAWAAGFFDGEGNIRCGSGNRLRLTVSQIDPRPLERFKKVTGGLGNVGGPYLQRKKDGANRKPIWHFYASNRTALPALAAIFPDLSPVKMNQVFDALRKYDDVGPERKWQVCARNGHRVRRDPRRKNSHFCATCRNEWSKNHREAA